MLKLLKVLRVIRAVRILRMLDFFEGLYRAMATFIDSVFILVWPLLYFFCINYMFTLVTIFLIGRNNQFEKPRPLDDCSGCARYQHDLEKWHGLQASVESFRYFHTSSGVYFRMAFFSSDNMLYIMDETKWSIAYFVTYVYVVRLCIMMAFYSILQDMIIKDTDAEKFVMKVDEMVVNINRMMRNILIGMEADSKGEGQKFKAEEVSKSLFVDSSKKAKSVDFSHKTRLIYRENFSGGYHHSPQFCKMQDFLRLSDDDFPLIFDIVDLDGSGDISVPELVNMFRLLKFMVADSAVSVRIQNSDLQKQRLYIIENYFKMKQVAVV